LGTPPQLVAPVDPVRLLVRWRPLRSVSGSFCSVPEDLWPTEARTPGALEVISLKGLRAAQEGVGVEMACRGLLEG